MKRPQNRSQSLAGYIRQHLAEIEARLEVGIRQEVIVEELEAQGYATTLSGFRNFLYRARKRAEKLPNKEIKSENKTVQNSSNTEAPKPLMQNQGDPLTFAYKGTKGINEEDLI